MTVIMVMTMFMFMMTMVMGTYLIVDICNVHLPEQVVTKIVRENSPNYVEGQIGSRVTHVSAIIHGRAADVATQRASIGYEGDLYII